MSTYCDRRPTAIEFHGSLCTSVMHVQITFCISVALFPPDCSKDLIELLNPLNTIFELGVEISDDIIHMQLGIGWVKSHLVLS